MGKYDGFLSVPTIRFELEGAKMAIVQCLNDRNDEIIQLINKGIDLAKERLPLLVVEEVRSGIVEGLEKAVMKATEEFYGPGGDGYKMIMDEIRRSIAG